MATDKLPVPIQFDPTYNKPLDAREEMFNNLSEVEAFIEQKKAYPGQIVKVRLGSDKAEVYIITDDMVPKKLMSSGSSGGGGGGGDINLDDIIGSITWNIYK